MVTPDERRAIQLAHLVEGLHQRELANRFGRTRETNSIYHDAAHPSHVVLPIVPAGTGR